MKKTVAIIHYNTPELTEALIFSIRKHGGEDYRVVVFDNSTDYIDKHGDACKARPFRTICKAERKLWGKGGVKVYNNRHGKIIDLERELERYHERDEHIGCAQGCWYGSDKHMMTVQKLWELIPEGFVLIDSDVLIKDDFDFMFMPDECCCGYIHKSSGPMQIERLVPMLLWINVPMCEAGGARFFDPDRAWALHKGYDSPKNFWDTGAAFLDDIRRLKPQCHGIAITRERILAVIEHYGGGSWHGNDLLKQAKWLEKNRDLWE